MCTQCGHKVMKMISWHASYTIHLTIGQQCILSEQITLFLAPLSLFAACLLIYTFYDVLPNMLKSMFNLSLHTRTHTIHHVACDVHFGKLDSLKGIYRITHVHWNRMRIIAHIKIRIVRRIHEERVVEEQRDSRLLDIIRSYGARYTMPTRNSNESTIIWSK